MDHGSFLVYRCITVRIGFIGIGMRGRDAVRRFMNIEGVEVKALCDLEPYNIDQVQKTLRDNNRPPAATYMGENDWKKVCERDDEQFQVLETDPNGNLWLALSVLDISPDQQNETAISQVINFRNGELFLPPVQNNSLPNLSSRELEILNMVKQGFYSKEISDKLSISVNTVNTHRQNILTKLQANNSIEAVRYASRLGLLK